MNNYQIIILTRDEYFYVPNYCRHIFSEYNGYIDSVIINKKGSPHLKLKKLIRLFSLKGFIIHSLQHFWLKYIAKQGIIEKCKGYDIKYAFFNDNTFRLLDDYLEGKDNVILLSIANSKIIPSSILKKVRYALNIHSSLLPRYKGILTAFWTLLNGEEFTGVTIHTITDNLDCGDIVFQEKLDIKNIKTMHSIYLNLSDIAGTGLKKILDDIFNGKEIKFIKQDSSDDRIYKTPSDQEITEFRKKGLRFR